MTTKDLGEWARARLGHEFKDMAVLERALTHPSIGGEQSYQRLEFVGDRVLGLVIANWLFERHPDEPEGRLATRFTGLVRREALADVARAIAVEPYIRVSRSARDDGTAAKDSVLADVCEALIGALYRDGGLKAAHAFIREVWADLIEDGRAKPRKDAKTRLQEWAQGRGLSAPTYEEVARTGPDHKPHFTMAAIVDGHEPTHGEGTSKREAEQAAATAFLAQVEE